MTLRLKRPLVFMTQSIGPFKTKSASTARLGAILSEASWIMARDALTIEVVKDIAPNARVSLIPDMAFYMSSLPEVARIERTPRAVRVAPQIGVSVRHWTHFRGQDAEIGMHRYLDAVARTVSQVVRELGAEVSFVSTSQGVPSYPFDDSRVAQEVASLLPSDVEPNVHVDSQFRTPYELIRKFASLDALVATRMHAVILGWLAGTPAVGIAYEPKTKELYDRYGIPALVHNIETLQAAELVDDVVRCLNHSVEDISVLRLRVDQEVSALNRTGRELQRIVENAT
jgi:colanic acid/amylovoran biosynthesis protein